MPDWEKVLREQLAQEIINQPLATERLVHTIVSISAGISHPRRPPQPFFFVGPSGSGKTFTAETVARLWLGASDDGSEGPLIKLSGENFEQEHEGAVFRGAPPGYAGYNQGTPLDDIGVFDSRQRMQDVEDRIRAWTRHAEELVQKVFEEMFAALRAPDERAGILKDQIIEFLNLVLNSKFEELRERFRSERGPFRSVLLVDEFEKMHPKNQEQFLTLLNDGRFTTNSGRTIDLRGTLIIFTSNIGSEAIVDILQENHIGFRHPIRAEAPEAQDMNQRIYKIIERKVRKFMIPALYSRIGKEGIVVFRVLMREDYARILERELSLLQAQLSETYATRRVSISVSPSCKDFLLEKIDNAQEGARQIGHIVDKYVRYALAQGLAGGVLRGQEFVLFDVANDDTPQIVMKRVRQGNLAEAAAAFPSIVPAQTLRSIVPPPTPHKKMTNLDIVNRELDGFLFEFLKLMRKNIKEFEGVFRGKPEAD